MRLDDDFHFVTQGFFDFKNIECCKYVETCGRSLPTPSAFDVMDGICFRKEELIQACMGGSTSIFARYGDQVDASLALHSGQENYTLGAEEMELHKCFRLKTAYLGYQRLHAEATDSFFKHHGARGFFRFGLLLDTSGALYVSQNMFVEAVSTLNADVLRHYLWGLFFMFVLGVLRAEEEGSLPQEF